MDDENEIVKFNWKTDSCGLAFSHVKRYGVHVQLDCDQSQVDADHLAPNEVQSLMAKIESTTGKILGEGHKICLARLVPTSKYLVKLPMHLAVHRIHRSLELLC